MRDSHNHCAEQTLSIAAPHLRLRKYLRWNACSRRSPLVLLALTLSVPAAFAGDREVLSRLPPTYPELARRMRIGGKVQLEVTVRPDGSVDHAKAMSGHPLLVPAAEDCATRWRFIPQGHTAVYYVDINFNLD